MGIFYKDYKVMINGVLTPLEISDDEYLVRNTGAKHIYLTAGNVTIAIVYSSRTDNPLDVIIDIIAQYSAQVYSYIDVPARYHPIRITFYENFYSNEDKRRFSFKDIILDESENPGLRMFAAKQEVGWMYSRLKEDEAKSLLKSWKEFFKVAEYSRKDHVFIAQSAMAGDLEPEYAALDYSIRRYFSKRKKYASRTEKDSAKALLYFVNDSTHTAKTLSEYALPNDPYCIPTVLTRPGASILKVTDLPLGTKMFRKYLQGLSREQIVRLIDEVPTNSSGSVAIAIADRLLSDDDDDEITSVEAIRMAGEIYHTYFKINYSSMDVYDLKSIHVLLMNKHQMYPSCIKAIYDIRSDYQGVELIKDGLVFKVLLDRFLIKTWIRSVDCAEQIVKLLVRATSPLKAIEIIMEVSASDQSFTPSQWTRAIEDNKDAADMPASWWLSLML